ncbi:MAG: urea ABC transporter permease subunit UrtB [Gloeobacteraceae cyanobacterium ES-bin-144]|nr:urea ABC transporter permease subunit UrtB [Verrucomicrobiales bacterium]
MIVSPFHCSAMRFCIWLITSMVIVASPIARAADGASVRETIAAAVTADTPAKQREIVLSLKSTPSPEVVSWFDKWKEGAIFLVEDAAGKKTAVLLTGAAGPNDSFATLKLADGSAMLAADGNPLRINPKAVEFAETSSGIRKAMKEVSDLAALADPDPVKRIRAIQDSANGQNPEKLPALIALQALEKNPKAQRALKESIAIIRLKSTDRAERIEACNILGSFGSLAAKDTLKSVLTEAEAAKDKQAIVAAKSALKKIESHISSINAVGTVFRGLSLGSVLLVVAIGLAITFGLMGIINMAHGELIAIGAYTTYMMQNIFSGGLKLSPFGYSIAIPGLNLSNGGNLYFAFALPASFLAAAAGGLLLERSVIRFLYRRPLESLLATWGISLVLQQLLRLIFGANNVQVTSPSWLSGNWTINDVVFGWNRVFVICFAALIIVVTWLVLNKTSLGLLIRAVMQNRNMAACMGVRTERVNMMTFAFGCGLAGLAGAFLSQIGNVGPSLGQNYIVDAFMTVVVGGVGNILGTVISALGIGLADQSLQQYLGSPVIGKILVLGAIILFLQWRPAGIFVTRSRSLD